MVFVCSWPVDTSACCPPDTDDSPEHVALVESTVARVSAMLTRLSGYSVGQCVATVRPLDACSGCRRSCCGGADGIRLVGPESLWVDSVTEVRDGITVVDPSTYRWDVPEQTLWRVPPDRWPSRDTRWDDCGTGSAFCVDVTVGSEPDAWALQVAATLTCELINACTGGKCRIPKNATQVSAQGITITLSDEELMGLLPEVAGWVKSVNPHKSVLPARVFSPDLDQQGTRGGGGSPLILVARTTTIDGGWA